MWRVRRKLGVWWCRDGPGTYHSRTCQGKTRKKPVQFFTDPLLTDPFWPEPSGAKVSQTPLTQARNKNVIEAAILNRVLDRDWTLNRRGPLCAWSMSQERVHWAGSASNPEQRPWQCRGLCRHLAGSAVPLLWLQSSGIAAQTPNGWG